MKWRIPLSAMSVVILASCGRNGGEHAGEGLRNDAPMIAAAERSSAAEVATPATVESSTPPPSAPEAVWPAGFRAATESVPAAESAAESASTSSEAATSADAIEDSAPESRDDAEGQPLPTTALTDDSTESEPAESAVLPRAEAPTATTADRAVEPVAVRPAPSAKAYQEALAEIRKYRSDVSPFKAEKADGDKTAVWLGDGVNALSNTRLPTCLDLSTLQKQTRKLSQTRDDFDFVQNNFDYWKKTAPSWSVGGNGVIKGVNIAPSVEHSQNRDTYLTKDDIVAVSAFNFLAEEQSVYNARPDLAPYFDDLVAGGDRGLFRSLCGDRYVKSVTLGASMRIVFNVKKRDSKKYEKDTVKSALTAGLTSLFSVSASFNFSREQQEILRNYSITMKCSTAGTKANVCAEYALNTTFNFENDAQSIQGRMDQARKRMAAEVDSGQNLIIIGEKHEDYAVPMAHCTFGGDEACPSAKTVFYDYRAREQTSSKILSTLEEMDDICIATPFWKNRCQFVRDQLTSALRICAETNLACKEVEDQTQLDVLRTVRNPGSFSLWRHYDRGGDIYSVDFKGGDVKGRFQSNTLYPFVDIGWASFSDCASSVEVRLNKGWKIRFNQHAEVENLGQSIEMEGTQYIDRLNSLNVNDEISSFELVAPPDL